MSILFRDALVLDLAGGAHIRGPVDVLVEGDRVAAVAPRLRAVAAPDARVVSCGGHQLLVPGLVNAHFHSPANHLKASVPSSPLELFMLAESPSDPALTPTPREAYLRTMLGAIEMLQRGITSVQDDAFVMPAPTPDIVDAIVQAYVDSGIRATVALDQPELTERAKLPFLGELSGVDLDAPPPASAEALLEQVDRLIATWHGAAGGRIRAAVSVSAPQRVSPEYFAALDDRARSYGLTLFAHMLETKPQRALMTEQPRFEGRSLVRYTADLGLLGPHTNVIHAVWVDDDDLDLIAESGASIAHNPVSNLRLGSGVMPWRSALDRGIPVALGTDEAICDDTINVWTVAKTAGLIHNIAGLPPERWPTADEVLTALWTGGARASGRAGLLGAVQPGMLADLALLELRSLTFTPLNDIAQHLVYGEDGRDVLLTVVAGRIVAEHGRITTVDESALLEEAREVFAARRPAIAAARTAQTAIAPAYARMLERARTTDVGFTRWVGTR